MKKKTLKIILIGILAILLIICSAMISQATVGDALSPEDEYHFLDNIGSFFSVDGVVGILLLPLKIFIIILGTIIRAISGGIALIGGADSLGAGLDTIMLSPEDIMFNKIKLTDINIFDFSVSGAMLTIRQNIATWYYALRNLSVVILLVILVYVGLRMALATVAEDAAKYKKMLIDWVVSFILVFLLHYIIIFTVWASDGFVEILSNSLQSSTQFGQAITDILARSMDLRLTVGLGSALVYVLLCALTFVFLVMYIRRMLTVSFLILIAPIITITYSIDKMGDGKSQAVNTWLREFVYNVLIQPFHCLVYLVFGTTAVSLMNGSLASSVLAIVIIMFILQAEKILKQIFGFKASSLGDGLASAVAVGAGVKMVSSKIAGNAKSSGAVSGSDGGGTPSKPADLGKASSSYAAMMGAGSSGGSGGSSGGSGSSSGAPSPYSSGSGGSGGGSGGPSPYSGGSAGSGSGGSSPYSGGSSIPGKAAQVGGLLANKGKNLGKAALGKLSPSAQFRMAARMTGAAFGAVTGDVTTAMGMGTLGGAVGKKATDAVQSHSIKKRVNKNEQYFANAYKDYERDTGMDIDELKAKTQEILDMDIADIEDQDKAYASFVYAMRDTYADAGESDARKKLLETIDKINNGDIKPKQKK